MVADDEITMGVAFLNDKMETLKHLPLEPMIIAKYNEARDYRDTLIMISNAKNLLEIAFSRQVMANE